MNEFSLLALSPVLPELFLAISGMMLLILGVYRGNESTDRLCTLTALCFVMTAVILLNVGWERTSLFGGLFVMDHFTGFMKLLILTGLIASLSLSGKYLQQEQIDRFEYPVLVLFAGLGMMMMVSANNLLSLYMGLELQSLSLYILAAFRRDNIKSTEAGIKYFVLGALASGMLLFGASLIYGYTGSLDFDVIAGTLSGAAPSAMPSIALITGLVFLLTGIAFKISAVPFHMWTPDVYEGAPTCVTALFAIVPKVAAMALLMRLLYGPFGGIMDEWQQILWFLAVASMILGAFAAITQNNIKRLMAYSSIGNMGYAMVGIVAGTPEGVGAVIVYMAIYMVMTAGAFAVIITMRRREMALENIDDLAGLSQNNPAMAYAMAIIMFSMSGIPPLAGFFGKILIFQAAVASGFYILALIGLLSSVVAAYYYLRVIKVMFFDEPADPFDRDTAFGTRAVLFVSVAFILLFIFVPNTLIDSGRDVAVALFTG